MKKKYWPGEKSHFEYLTVLKTESLLIEIWNPKVSKRGFALPVYDISNLYFYLYIDISIS